jgi:hypothetical protein
MGEAGQHPYRAEARRGYADVGELWSQGTSA